MWDIILVSGNPIVEILMQLCDDTDKCFEIGLKPQYHSETKSAWFKKLLAWNFPQYWNDSCLGASWLTCREMSLTVYAGPWHVWASLVAQLVKNPPAMRETWVRSLGWEDPLEKGKATHSSILAWRIPWTESMGLQKVGHDWMTFTFTFFKFHWGKSYNCVKASWYRE